MNLYEPAVDFSYSRVVLWKPVKNLNILYQAPDNIASEK
jgi:hypothetical protein